MPKKIFLEKQAPEELKEEIIFLYKLGVEIQELEYLIKIKFIEEMN